MEIKRQSSVSKTPVVRRGLSLSIFYGVAHLLSIPFGFLKKGILFVKEDNAKIDRFKRWAKRENQRRRRAYRLNDEL